MLTAAASVPLTLGWIPEGREVPGELSLLSQPLDTLFSYENCHLSPSLGDPEIPVSLLSPSEQLASVLAPVH